MRINIDSKVLQRIAVNDRLRRVLLRELQKTSVVLCKVVHYLLGDGWQVEDAVEQVCSPEGVKGGLGDGVALAADRGEPAAGGV